MWHELNEYLLSKVFIVVLFAVEDFLNALYISVGSQEK